LPQKESFKIPLQSISEAQSILGHQDEFLTLFEDNFNVGIVLRDNSLEILGESDDEVQQSARVLEELLNLLRSGHPIGVNDVKYAIRLAKERKAVDLEVNVSEPIPVFSKRGVIRPKTPGQRRYVESMKNHDLVFAIGPAGTGKTYLAMAMAVSALKTNQVSRIILTRPAVEAGERLGFLPGDIAAKVDPYLRPLYDALYDMMSPEVMEKYMERGVIEVAPLAFMRGRTLNNSFVILDEAQNSTIEQMKMFLTRLGFDSKAVVTGDITQIDLSSEKTSGLLDVQSVLSEVEGISFIYFSAEDVVRHELVQRIIEAYEERDKKKTLENKTL
jgi:phosphate starvation-inducible PhoH-like protein